MTFTPNAKSSYTTASGKVFISYTSFKHGGGFLRANIAHEYGHYSKDVEWIDKVGGKNTGDWVSKPYEAYKGDGTSGYFNAIKNSGKYQLQYSDLTNPHFGQLGRDAYNDYTGPKKWNLIPRRY